MLSPRTLHAPRTERLWPWTEAEAMIETAVVVALCEALIEQIQCQAASQCCALEYGLSFKQVKMKEEQGRPGEWVT